METVNSPINTTSIDNSRENLDELESLRFDYALLKEKLDKQEIINEKLLRKTFSSKIKSIHSISWAIIVLGIIVIIMAPLYFHLIMHLSWAFVAGTILLMIACMYTTQRFNKPLSSLNEEDDLFKYAENAKMTRDKYKEWQKYGISLALVWFAWFAIELYIVTEDKSLALITIGCCIIGGTIGGLIGLKMDKKIIRNCDEIINEIKALNN